SILFRLRPRHLARYRRIAEVMARHGFGAILTQLGLAERLSLPRRLLRRDEEYERVPPAVRLRLALEELGATFIKLGQIASTRPEIVPPSVLAELSNLQDNVPPAPWEEVLPLIEAELGRPLAELFAAFDPTPMASASLAQVYPALLPDGTHVVVKVQRPGVERQVETDLNILRDLAQLARDRLPGYLPFDPVDLAGEFAQALREELDYVREGRNADRFRENFETEDHLYVPRVYWEYTTRRLIVQERIRGIKIDDLAALAAGGYDRERIAHHAARLIIKEVLEDGFFHADPHPGNMIVLPGEAIGLIDFGTVGYLDERDKGNLIRLYIAIIQFDATAAVEQLIRMRIADPGVDELGLERALRRLLRRYTNVPLKDLSATELLAEIQPIIYEYRLRVPSDYWLLIKTLVIMEGVGKQLAPDFDVFAVSAPYVRRFLIQLALPTSWGPDALRSLGSWAGFISDLPGQTGRLLNRIERGQLELRIQDPATEHLTRQLNQVANRIIQAILLGSLTIGLALMLPTLDLSWPWGLITWLAVLTFGLAVVLTLWLLWAIWRSGRRM
ncbi:ABC1 kinase family protein, partial [Promineifilum sp.]|uniref:ABC1 kinase family protein n=1 Tax=Promineifilum sp. TaxID=2664178 RepID=UPI0035B23B95